MDRGGNAPNLFQDPKSSENALPPHSTGARDDRMQRRALEAVLTHFEDVQNNPVSAVYGGRMVEGADAWCWDARPFPAFPARGEVWADAGAWRAGHWLNGRMGGEAADLVAAVLKRGGLAEEAFEIGALDGEIAGYVIDRPMRTRDALEPLLAGLGATAAERGGRIAVLGEAAVGLTLTAEALALPDEGASVVADRSLEPRPGAARVRFIDEAADYQTGSVVVRGAGDGGGIDLELPAVCGAGVAGALARRTLATTGGETDRLTVKLGPLEALRLEPGEVVQVEGRAGDWRVTRLDVDEQPSAVLEPVVVVRVDEAPTDWRPGDGPAVVGAPFLRLLDLPPLPGAEEDGRPVVVVAAEPWTPMAVHGGASVEALTPRATVVRPATVGVLIEAVGRGVVGRWDEMNALMVRVEGRAPESLTAGGVLGGGNALALETAAGWEVVQYRRADLVGGEVWRLSGLLRGQQGSEEATETGALAGAVVVFLERDMARAEVAPGERGLPRLWRAGPAGAAPGGSGFSEVDFSWTGRAARPWRPAHLRVAVEDGGRRLSWTPRVRVNGEGWEAEPVEVDPRRFRVRVLDGAAEKRVWEVEGPEAVYAAAQVAADWPGGVSGGARIAVAQWGAGYGWGAEAVAPLL
ncbi:hypothetical protein D3C86_961070 [compost metagenome]